MDATLTGAAFIGRGMARIAVLRNAFTRKSDSDTALVSPRSDRETQFTDPEEQLYDTIWAVTLRDVNRTAEHTEDICEALIPLIKGIPGRALLYHQADRHGLARLVDLLVTLAAHLQQFCEPAQFHDPRVRLVNVRLALADVTLRMRNVFMMLVRLKAVLSLVERAPVFPDGSITRERVSMVRATHWNRLNEVGDLATEILGAMPALVRPIQLVIQLVLPRMNNTRVGLEDHDGPTAGIREGRSTDSSMHANSTHEASDQSAATLESVDEPDQAMKLAIAGIWDIVKLWGADRDRGGSGLGGTHRLEPWAGSGPTGTVNSSSAGLVREQFRATITSSLGVGLAIGDTEIEDATEQGRSGELSFETELTRPVQRNLSIVTPRYDSAGHSRRQHSTDPQGWHLNKAHSNPQVGSDQLFLDKALPPLPPQAPGRVTWALTQWNRRSGSDQDNRLIPPVPQSQSHNQQQWENIEEIERLRRQVDELQRQLARATMVDSMGRRRTVSTPPPRASMESTTDPPPPYSANSRRENGMIGPAWYR